MLILNQDREKLIVYKGGLYTMPVIIEGTLMGINLYCDDEFLGTFDSVKEALQEMDDIRMCKHEFYCVTGFSDFDIIEHIMLEDEFIMNEGGCFDEMA